MNQSLSRLAHFLLVFAALSACGSAARADAIGFSSVPSQTYALGSFNIAINSGAGLSGNQAALDAFNRAANQWVNRISDPFTVYINADLSSGFSNANTIGQANSVGLATDYDTVRNQIVADAADEADDGIVRFLPTAAQFNATLPTGFSFSGNIAGNKANFKALGFAGLDAQFGNTDGNITFNSAFAFDFDNRDGVDANKVDFETVAAHEIGHVLGFVSAVDDVDFLISQGMAGAVDVNPLDLFRFQNGTANDPTTTGEFTTASRFLGVGGDAILDDLDGELGLSTGVSKGDGRQASHWKDNDLTGFTLGIMDPTLANGQIIRVGDNDLRALDLIGYDVQPVPEPSTLAMMGLGLAGLIARRRKKKSAGATITADL